MMIRARHTIKIFRENSKCCLLSALLLLIGLRLAWLILPGYLYPLPETLFDTRAYSQVVLDNQKTPIRWELGWRDQWRFHTPLKRISPHLIRATLAAEDRRFYQHNGIDWWSAARAVRDNLLSRRVRSGASTISMQVARMRMPDVPRGWARKCQQTGWALNIERHYSKNWILETYLNNAPYGGNSVGAQAAAKKYFSKSAADLRAGEAALLAGLPQRPSALRPDRHPVRALTRQKYVIERMKTIYPERYAGLKAGFHLQPTRRFNAHQNANLLHFCQLALREAGEKTAGTPRAYLHSTLNLSMQGLLVEALSKGVGRLEGVNNAGGVIVENASAAVLALVGTLDVGNLPDGMVNTCTARRSSGSTLKPFIYAAAIEKGLLVPQTLLDDSPLVMGNYSPQNFSGDFTGMIPAVDALSQSLNTPAARVLSAVGLEDTLDILRQCGIKSLTRGGRDYGLSLALGGGEVTVLDLAEAYCGLARGGLCKPLTFLRDGSPSPYPSPFSRGTIVMITDMLASYPLPGLANYHNVSWKTGTSNGFRDAWCCAYNRDYTVIVWLGNKNGAGSSGLIGAESSLPVAAEIFTGLIQETPAAPQSTAQAYSFFEAVELCRSSGLRAGSFCQERYTGRGVKGIPLRPCLVCRRLRYDQHKQDGDSQASRNQILREKLTILSPLPRVYFVKENHLSLQLESSGSTEVRWFDNGKILSAKGNCKQVDFSPGKHHIVAVDPAGGKTAALFFEVRTYD